MTYSNVGFRACKTIERPDEQLIKAFYGIPSSNIGDCMNRLSCMNSDIKPMSDFEFMAGPAFTVKVAPGDNLMFHIALDLAEPGDILVIDGQGSNERALFGEFMARYADVRKLGGIVAYGCLRDISGICELKTPIYATGITPKGPWKFGPGEINVPVVCAGQAVLPGDILVGDKDGIVVIHKEDAVQVLADAQKKFAYENELMEEYKNGDIGAEGHFTNYSSMAKEKGATL